MRNREVDLGPGPLDNPNWPNQQIIKGVQKILGARVCFETMDELPYLPKTLKALGRSSTAVQEAHVNRARLLANLTESDRRTGQKDLRPSAVAKRYGLVDNPKIQLR